MLYSFTGTKDGQNPQGGLIIDSAGNLYGVTSLIVFKLSPKGKLTVLHTFAGGPNDGASPQGGLIMDSAGNLYGTTSGGGTSFNGTVFELMP